MGSNKRVNLDLQPAEILEGESADEFLRRTGKSGRVLTHVQGDKEVPVRDLSDVPDGADLGTIAESRLG